jgi:hypothetical protein
MFTPDEIQARLRTRPFIPLRIRLTDGPILDVFHPDLVLVGRRDVTVGQASTENATQYDRVTRVAIMHITALEDLPMPHPPPTSNGQAS